jgi:hypothetical protein
MILGGQSKAFMEGKKMRESGALPPHVSPSRVSSDQIGPVARTIR